MAELTPPVDVCWLYMLQQARNQKKFQGGLPTEELGVYGYTPKSRRHDLLDVQIVFFLIGVFFYLLNF